MQTGGVFLVRAGLARRLTVTVRSLPPPPGTQASSLALSEICAISAGEVLSATAADGPLVCVCSYVSDGYPDEC